MHHSRRFVQAEPVLQLGLHQVPPVALGSGSAAWRLTKIIQADPASWVGVVQVASIARSGMPMSPKAKFALLLLSLCASALAQDPAASSDPSLESMASKKPPMAAISSAFAGSGLSQVSTRVVVTYDSSGRILEAKVQPSTHDRNLDKAIRDWAKQVQLKPGPAGTGWFPIDISRSP